MNENYLSKDYRVSRGAYKVQCMLDYFVSLTVSDAFLAKLLTHIGIDDSVTGVISSIISAAFLFQLVPLFFADSIKSAKKTVISFDSVSQLCFLFLYLVPFLPAARGVKTVCVVASMILGYFFLYLNNNIAYNWGNSFVDPGSRATYSASKEMISLIGGVVFVLFIGYVSDRYEEKGNLPGAFMFIAVCIAVVCAADFGSLVLIKDGRVVSGGEKKTLRQVLARTFGNKDFRHVIIQTAVFDMSRYMTVGFMGTFKNNDLGLRMKNVQFINTAGCLARFAVSRPFGRYSDRHSFSDGFRLSLFLEAAGCAAGVFASVSPVFCVVAYTLMSNMSLAGSSQNTYNMAYSYCEKDYVLYAMAVNNSVKGVAGFCSSLAGSAIVRAVAKRDGLLFGHKIYAQQILCFISLILTCVTIVYNKLVVSKQKVTKQ